MDSTLLTHLAFKFIPKMPEHVETELRAWSFMETNMQEPKGWLRKKLFHWVLDKVTERRLTYQTYRRAGMVYVGQFEGDAGDIESGLVNFEITKPE